MKRTLTNANLVHVKTEDFVFITLIVTHAYAHQDLRE